MGQRHPARAQQRPRGGADGASHRIVGTVELRMNHGTTTAYNKGCRCADCRRAQADKQRRRYHDGSLARCIPAAPLVDVLASRNQRGLARAFAYRYGRDPRLVARSLGRLLRAERVQIHTADEWLTLLGSHLDIVYGEEVRA
jgi:hypothetical protein